ncbi:MAG: hypothetical protein K0S63_334 [Gammaproteobacteria bacterium]|jgi:hypothetical protein|nr:hypothetical protein [Gammaproteobacteria bacterium]
MNDFPLYFHPSTVLLVDDDIAFLKMLIKKLDQKNSYRLSDEPQKTLELLLSKNEAQTHVPIQNEEEHESADQTSVLFKLNPSYVHLIHKITGLKNIAF